ncbi:hypothetical protein GCM10010112_65930 [Actinoplanes lobatus]|uniref:Excreted virulence factor EspC (Type VII ESX diderm) n=1 Tax=Actinoplanes lobatus TaxID=113568 RepID=A0A7W7HJZ0_9ACTN|nr:hypothetical protein [Actinoplanes lobatus]MBB4751931.1 hypothetical protein [Actinoplanes lobatus]GGN85477.1 hypothetical protein GCM10010112_65930 [Actinoplanes lobatus]GIE44342.1 hypothetical protein Alo02nite_72400 [Actinoplanes lobatus]
MQPDVHIDVEGLRRTGVRVRTPLIAVDHAIEQAVPHLTVAGRAAEWGTAPVLSGAAAGWRAHLNGLAQRVRKLGDDLVASADEFEAADRAAAGSFHVPVPSPAPTRSFNVPVPQGDGR